MNPMTFEEYVVEVQREHLSNKALRLGQAYFNVLNRHRPDLAERVRGVFTMDPFYRDNNIPSFLEFLGDNWTVQ